MGTNLQKYPYSWKRLLINLIFGVMWMTIGVSYIFTDAKLGWNAYVTIFIGTLYLATFLYEYIQKYVVITADKIVIGTFPALKVDINEIQNIELRPKSIQITTTTNSVTIEISKIDKTQQPKIKYFFQTLKSGSTKF